MRFDVLLEDASPFFVALVTPPGEVPEKASAETAPDPSEHSRDPARDSAQTERRLSGIAPISEEGPDGAPPVLHPRGRILPPLPPSASIWRRFVRAVLRLAQGLYHHDDIFHAAPAMAFHFFLSLLPLLVFIGYVLGLVAQRKGASAVLGIVLDNLPPTTEAVLKKEVSRLAAADRLGPLAAIGFLWIASGGTQGLIQAIERVVGAPRRAWWRQRLLAVAWVFGTMAAFGIASFGIIEWDEVVHSPDEPPASTATAPTKAPLAADVDEVVSSGGSSGNAARPQVVTRPEPVKRARRILRIGGERVLAVGFSLVAAVGVLAAFYRFAVAHSRRVRRRVLPGALLAMALVIVVSWGFSLYVRTLASYAVYYGSLAAIAVLLVWLWLMSLAILVGAELNSQLEGLRD